MPDKQWDDFVAAARKNAVAKIAESAITICLSPPGPVDDFDVKQALELGASILLDKPIIIVRPAGRPIRPGLHRVASHVVEMEHDIDLEAGQDELQRKLLPILEQLGVMP